MHYKYFGLLAFAILFCGLTFIVLKWPQGKHMTFSQHVAVAQHKILYYILLFAFALPLLVLFFLQWFVPMFGLPVWFSLCLVLSAVTQQACTLIPEVGGWKTKYHRILAGTSGVALLPPIGLLIFSASTTSAAKLLASTSLVVMLCILGMAAARRGKNHLLLLQSGYYAAFFVPILFISYLQ